MVVVKERISVFILIIKTLLLHFKVGLGWTKIVSVKSDKDALLKQNEKILVTDKVAVNVSVTVTDNVAN